MKADSAWLASLARHHAGTKVLAALLAAASFYAIRSTTSTRLSMDVPVEVQVEKGVAVLSQDPLAVTVTLRGSDDDIQAIKTKEIRAVVRPKATSPQQGQERVPVTVGDLEGISRVRVVSMQPRSVRVSFDHEVGKPVAVAKPRTVGTPFRGKVEIEYEPQQVVIHGSSRGLHEVDEVDTEPIDVEGRVQSFTRKVRVLPPANMWVSRITPPEVSVKVSIVSKVTDRVWTNVPVLSILQPGTLPAVVCDPAAVTVTVRGRSEVLDAMGAGDVKVFVDCVGLRSPGTNTLPAMAHMPAGLDVTAAIAPDSVRVIVGPAPGPVEMNHGR